MTAVNNQLGSNAFFEHTSNFSTIRKDQDRIFTEEAFKDEELRNKIESFTAPDLTAPEDGSLAQQKIAADGANRVVQHISGQARSATMQRLQAQFEEHKLAEALQTKVCAALLDELERMYPCLLPLAATARG